MEFSVKKLGQAVIIRLTGRLDAITSPQFERDIEKCITSPQDNLVLDLAELDYISSAGLRIILKIAKAFNGVQWSLSLCQPQDHVREIFEMSGFEHFITLRDSVSECIEDENS